MPANAVPKPYPLFAEYSLQEISERTRYSMSYLVGIMYGWQPINARFQRTCALGFRRSEDALFGPQEPTPAAGKKG